MDFKRGMLILFTKVLVTVVIKKESSSTSGVGGETPLSYTYLFIKPK